MILKAARNAVFALALVGLAAPALADGYNTSQFLGAGQANAVNRGLAKANKEKNQDGAGSELGSTGCGGLNVGNVVTPQRGRTPREVTVVIKGDVTNVSKGFGGSGCR